MYKYYLFDIFNINNIIYNINMSIWVTKIREEIDGFQVDIIMNGKTCLLNEETRKMISKSLKKGRRSGVMGVYQPDRGTHILSKWKVPFDKVEVGDKIKFSTSGKYNPGYQTTDTYDGVVEKIDELQRCVVKSDKKKAFIPIKHIEEIL